MPHRTRDAPSDREPANKGCILTASFPPFCVEIALPSDSYSATNLRQADSNTRRELMSNAKRACENSR